MTITKPKPKTTQQETATADFIAGAPDSGTATKGVKKGNKQQISLTMSPALLAKVDALAEKGQYAHSCNSRQIISRMECPHSIMASRRHATPHFRRVTRRVCEVALEQRRTGNAVVTISR